MSPASRAATLARRTALVAERLPGGRAALRSARGTQFAALLRGEPTLLHSDRLVESPVFMYSCVRSGSTLLRVLLNSHSAICAPHEMHLNSIRVTVPGNHVQKSVRELGLTADLMEGLLWDRIMARELLLSGKRIIVDKTPQNVFDRERIEQMWPHARYVILRRHPASIIASLQAARTDWTHERCVERVAQYVDAIGAARAELPGLDLRYEDLTTAPETTLRRVCAHLDVPWEPQMLEYGKSRHGRFVGGIGDWSEKIKSGRIQPPTPPPFTGELSPAVRDLAAAWGYA